MPCRDTGYLGAMGICRFNSYCSHTAVGSKIQTCIAVVGLATHHSTFIGGILMDKFDRYLECMDNKIAELDAEIKHLQAEKDILSTMRIRADVFKTLPEDEECINWP
jgi:hypothetical protein